MMTVSWKTRVLILKFSFFPLGWFLDCFIRYFEEMFFLIPHCAGCMYYVYFLFYSWEEVFL